MKVKDVFDESLDGEDVIRLIESINLEKSSKDELKNIIEHLKHQFKNRYMYLVGEWQGARRAKNTRNGLFTSKGEVISYLNNEI